MRKKELYEILDWIFDFDTPSPKRYGDWVGFQIEIPKFNKKKKSHIRSQKLILEFILERDNYYGSKKH